MSAFFKRYATALDVSTAVAAAVATLANGAAAGAGSGTIGHGLAIPYAPGSAGAGIQAAAAAALAAQGTANTAQAARPVLQNILTNTRWMVATTWRCSAKVADDGVTPLATLAVTSYTINSNTVVCLTANTAGLKVGHLLSFAVPADVALRITTTRVQSIVPNVSFTIILPVGLKAAVSAACVATIMEIGGANSAGSGHGFDHWTKSGSLIVWREGQGPNTAPDALYSCGARKTIAGVENYYWQAPAQSMAALRGGAMSAAGKIKIPAGTSVRAFINRDGTGGGQVFGAAAAAAGFQSIKVENVSIPDDATYVHIGFELTGAIGTAFYIHPPCAGLGTSIDLANAPRELVSWIKPVVKMSPYAWVNANITFPTVADAAGTYSWPIDWYADTEGAFAPQVQQINLLLEMIFTAPQLTLTDTQAVGIRNVEAPPIVYGVIAFHAGQNIKTACGGLVTLNDAGGGLVYTGTSGLNIANVSIDCDGVWV